MNDQEIETEIQAKGLTAPRATPQDIEDNIASEVFFTAADGYVGGLTTEDIQTMPVNVEGLPLVEPPAALELLTFCVLVLNNGFTVTGESACASPENFDAELGRKIARQNAVNKIWPLLGFLLKEKLHAKAA